MTYPLARNVSPEDQFAHVVAVCMRLHRDLQPITPERVQSELPDLTLTQCRKLLESDRLATALQERGVTFEPLDALSAHQMHALAIYADTSVPMTHRERLRNAKVTQAKWDGWMRNPRFAAALEEISEERLAHAVPQMNLRLMEAIDRGERWAIELGYAITGRFRANDTGQDASALFAAMFQILDEAGIPDQVMKQVGQAVKQLATPGSAPARAATVMLAPTGRPAPSITSLEE